jgi:hypothetical protein
MPQRLSNREQGDRGKESSCSPRGRARARSPEPSGDGGRRWREFAGGERRIAREQRARVERKKLSQATGSGREGFFKNGVWAHRTVYSARCHSRTHTQVRAKTDLKAPALSLLCARRVTRWKYPYCCWAVTLKWFLSRVPSDRGSPLLNLSQREAEGEGSHVARQETGS